jgi:uncharacterized protein with beta-barrel porin domain
VTQGWVEGFGRKIDLGNVPDFHGYDVESSGFAAGLDRQLTQRLTAGIALGRIDGDVTSDLGLSRSAVNSDLYSVYVGYLEEQRYGDAIVSYARNDADVRRSIEVGSLSAPVTSQRDSDAFSVLLGGGYFFRAGETWIDPFAYLHYTHLREGPSVEQGSDLALSVAARTTDELLSRLGVRLSRVFETRGGHLVPEASVAWVHDFETDSQRLQAAYVGSPDLHFSVGGQVMASDAALLSIGVGYFDRTGFSTGLRYQAEFRDHLGAHTLLGELRFRF